MKATKSKIHWIQFLLLPYIIIVGIGAMILTLKISIERPNDQLPIGSWILVGSFTSFGILILLWLIRFYKTLTITENDITIKYPIIGKELKYNNHEIISWYEHINIGKYNGEYKTFHFSTSDGKIYMFSDIEFRNYKQLFLLIISKSKCDYIDKLHNFKKVFIFFLISSAITALIIIITLKIGVK